MATPEHRLGEVQRGGRRGPAERVRSSRMDSTTATCVVVVAETDRLNKLGQSAVDKMGSKLRSGRAVKAEAKRFANKLAANPKPLRVEVLDVVGFSNPVKDRPDILEPIVLHEGKAVPVSTTYIGLAGEHHVVASRDLDRMRVEIVASCARRLAEDVFLNVAMAEAIFAVYPELTVEGFSTNAKTLAVELDVDDDGKIAKRLPKWIKVEPDEDPPKP